MSKNHKAHDSIKGVEWIHCLFLFSPCFRENVVVTCKIESFLCSFLQKKVIVFIFENQISKWRSFEKRAIFDLLFTFFSYQGKLAKIPSAHISLTYIYVFRSLCWLFFLSFFFWRYQFWKKTKYEFISYGFSLVWFRVFDSYSRGSRHFGTINK